MNTFVRPARLALALLLPLLAGCPFPMPWDDTGTAKTVAQGIGPEGGTLSLASGATLTIPAGALTSTVTITLEEDAGPATSTFDATIAGGAVVLGPEGQTFQKPVELTLPFDAAKVGAAAAAVRIYTAPVGSTQYTELATTVNAGAGTVTAKSLHFSTFVPAAPTNPNPLFITTDPPLPGALVGSPYAPLTFVANGGTAPYAWTLGTGALPPGLSLNISGQVTGTPVQSGSYAFSVRVTDSAAQAVEKVFQIDVQPAGGNPLPIVNNVTPAVIAAGSGDTQVILQGMNFVNGCYAFIGGTGLSTLWQSATSVQAVVPAALLASPGTLQIGVFNPAPGGGTSNTVTITVGTAGGLTVTGVNPGQVTVLSPDTVITVTGTGFAPGSAVTFDTMTLVTTFGSATSLTATVPAAQLATVGAHSIKVSNVLIGGGVSNGVPFVVVNQPPVITAMSPAQIPAGYPGATVVLTGTGFGAQGRAFLGALALGTSVQGATQATVQIPANALVNPGTFQLTFQNPAPGAATSAPFPFDVVPTPVPVTLWSAPQHPVQHLAVDDTTVYWTEIDGTGAAKDAVRRAPIGGGAVSVVAQGAPAAAMPRGIVVHNCNVSWVNDGWTLPNRRGALMTVPVNGGDPGLVARSIGELNLLNYDPGTDQLFWTTGPDVYGPSFRVAAKGGPAIETGGAGWLVDQVLDSGFTYFVSRGSGSNMFHDGFVGRRDLTGLGGNNIASWQDDPHGVAVGGGNVYWGVLNGEIRMAPVTGVPAGSQPTVFATSDRAVTSLAIDADRLYWTTDFDVRSKPLAGGPVTIHAYLTAGANLHALVVDAWNLYWGTDSGLVQQIAKPGATGGPPAVGACAGNPGWAFAAQLTDVGGYDLVTDGTWVYYTDGIGSGQGHVYKVKTDGTGFATVASGQQLPQTIRMDGAMVYWANYGTTNGQIMSWYSAGAAGPGVYSSAVSNPDSLAVEAGQVWWTNSATGGYVSHNGRAIVSGLGVPNFVVLDATNAYYQLNGALYSLPKTATNPTPPVKVIPSGVGGPIVRLGTTLYWLQGFANYTGRIEKYDLATGGPVQTVVNLPVYGIGLAVDSNGDLYWTSFGTDPSKQGGAVWRLRAGATTPVVLAEGQYQPTNVTFDAGNVYWVNAGTYGSAPLPGGVMKLPKGARP